MSDLKKLGQKHASCAKCAHWIKHVDIDDCGECRRYPPTKHSKYASDWEVVTHEADFCGEFLYNLDSMKRSHK